MNIKGKLIAAATVLLAVVFVFESDIRGQSPSSSPPASDPAADKAKSDAEAQAKAAAKLSQATDASAKAALGPYVPGKPAQAADADQKPAQASGAAAISAQAQKAAATPTTAPEPDFWHQEELTGNWGGTRSRWKDKGFEMEISLTNFVQGVASGGTEKGTEYNGTFQTLFKFDFGKLAGWKFWLAEIKAETRFGGPLLGGTGTINPVNTAAIIPGANNTIFSVTAVNVTKLFLINLQEGKLIALSFGRYNLVDLLAEDFFAGGGTERFFNIAQIGPLTVLRQVPLITNAVSFAYIRGGEPFITFAVLDPNDYSLEPGLAEIFEDGVTFSPGINFPTKYFGKSGKHTIGGAVTTKAYTPFDSIRQIIIPGPPINPVLPKRGSYSVNYVFRQYIVERAPHDGWGLFTQVSFADKDTSPITAFFDVGLGGNGLFKARRHDEFGVAYAYTDLSEVLKDNLDLLPFLGRRLRAEHQIETFYNFHITPWLQLTADLQVIRPTRPIADTAIVPGGRLKIIF
jgi:porin